METNNLQTIYFDGQSYILFPSFANFPKDVLTIEFWVKKETKNNVFFELVDNELVNYKVDLRFSFQDDKLLVTLFDSNITTRFALDNNWHHVAFVYKSFSKDDSVQIYIDGTSTPFDNTIDDFSTYKYSGKGDIYVGRKEFDSIFKGYIRNLRIWNSARTELEIRQRMSVSLMDFDDYLVGSWHFSTMNEIESKLGVRLPQSFADQERDLAEAIRDFSDNKYPNDQESGKQAINEALKTTLNILKETTQNTSNEDDKSKINDIRSDTATPAFEIRKEIKTSDVTITQLETIDSNLRNSLVEAGKLIEPKSLLSKELDSLFSVEKNWFKFYINNESKTCIINLSKSPIDNTILIDTQNISANNIDINNEIKIQLNLRNLLPPDQIELIKNKTIIGVKNDSCIEIDFGGVSNETKAYCTTELRSLPNGEDVLVIQFNELFTLEKNGTIRFRLKNIYSGDATREGYLVVEAIQEKQGGMSAILSSQAIFGLFLLPFLGKLPIENGIVGRNELYYSDIIDASTDTIESEITFYFANPSVSGLIPRKSLNDTKLVITTSLNLHYDVYTCNFSDLYSPRKESDNKWNSISNSKDEQSMMEITEFKFNAEYDAEYLFESMEILVIKATGNGIRNFPEFIPVSFEFKGFGGYNQTIFESFIRNIPTTSNFRSFNNAKSKNIGIGVSTPLLNLSIGHKKVGLQAETNADKSNKFETDKALRVQEKKIALEIAKAEFETAKELISKEAESKKNKVQADFDLAKDYNITTNQKKLDTEALLKLAEKKLIERAENKSRAEQKLPDVKAKAEEAQRQEEGATKKIVELENMKKQIEDELKNYLPTDSLINIDIFEFSNNTILQNLDYDTKLKFEKQITELKEVMFNQSKLCVELLAKKNEELGNKQQADTDFYNSGVSLRNAETERDILLAQLKSLIDEFKVSDVNLKNAKKKYDAIFSEKDRNIAIEIEKAKSKYNLAQADMDAAQESIAPKTELAFYADTKEQMRISDRGLEVVNNVKAADIHANNIKANGGINAKSILATDDIEATTIKAIDTVRANNINATSGIDANTLRVRDKINTNSLDVTNGIRTNSVVANSIFANTGMEANTIKATDSVTTNRLEVNSSINTKDINVNGTIKIDGGEMFKIIRYPRIGDCPNYQTRVPVSEWSAVIAGFLPEGGDFNERGTGTILQIYMNNSGGYWNIIGDVMTQNGNNENWTVDVLFIRRKLVTDNRC